MWVLVGCGVAVIGQGSGIPAPKIGDRWGDIQLRLPRNDVDASGAHWNRFRLEHDGGSISRMELEYHVTTWWRAPRNWVVVERHQVYYFPKHGTNSLDWRLARITSNWKVTRKSL